MRMLCEEDVRCVIEGLVPLLVLPRVLGWVQTTSSTVSFHLFSLMLLPPWGMHVIPSVFPPRAACELDTHPSSAGVMASTSRP